MVDSDLVSAYNYDEFTTAKVMPWLNFEASPPVGRRLIMLCGIWTAGSPA